VVAVSWPRLTGIDRRMASREDDIALLRRTALLRPLPLPAIEELAVRARSVSVPGGDPVFVQGDAGDCFYVVAEGAAEVRQDGRLLRVLRAGDGFGEIALLRRCRRTATVASKGGLVVRMIDRNAFLAAITGHRPTAGTAATIVSDLLDADARRTTDGGT